MKTVYLTRHGETVENKKGIYIGNSHGTLSNEGLRQAEKLGDYLKSKNCKIILTSDLRRSYKTARLINKKINSRIVKLPDLRERSIGSWAGVKKENFYKRIDKVKDLCRFKPGNGESYEDVALRAAKVIGHIKSLKENKVIVVAHGRFNKIMINYIMGKPLDSHIEQDNCCVNILKLGKEKNYAELVNYKIYA